MYPALKDPRSTELCQRISPTPKEEVMIFIHRGNTEKGVKQNNSVKKYSPINNYCVCVCERERVSLLFNGKHVKLSFEENPFI